MAQVQLKLMFNLSIIIQVVALIHLEQQMNYTALDYLIIDHVLFMTLIQKEQLLGHASRGIRIARI